MLKAIPAAVDALALLKRLAFSLPDQVDPTHGVVAAFLLDAICIHRIPGIESDDDRRRSSILPKLRVARESKTG